MKRSALINLGYSFDEAEKITTIYPDINGISIRSLNQRIEYLESYGYSRNDILKMIKLSPIICSLSIENLDQKLNCLEALGYSRNDILGITRTSPSLLISSPENITQKVEDLETLGYCREETLQMTKNLPHLFILTPEIIRERIEFYRSIDLDFWIVDKTQYLMQSTELSYARYRLVSDRRISLTSENYTQIFMAEKIFKKQYGVSKETLLSMYPYEKVSVKSKV